MFIRRMSLHVSDLQYFVAISFSENIFLFIVLP